MIFLGTLVNCFAVIVGSGIGLFLKKGISEKISTSIMNALALCVLYIGVKGAFECQNVLVVIVSMALGTFIGEWIDLDARLEGLGQRLENRLGKGKEKGSISSGFVAASLLFCVGAMTIVGSLQSGISGNHETLFAKSLIDGIAAMVLASALGLGVMLSAVFVLVYQGLITLCAGFLEPVLTEIIVCEMTAVGSLLVVGLSFNMLKITKIKVMNSVPAMFVPVAVYWGIELFNYVF